MFPAAFADSAVNIKCTKILGKILSFTFSWRRVIRYFHGLPARLGALAPFFYRDENGSRNAVFFVADKSGTLYLVAVACDENCAVYKGTPDKTGG